MCVSRHILVVFARFVYGVKIVVYFREFLRYSVSHLVTNLQVDELYTIRWG